VEKKLTYLPALDGIRGIAALMIMIFHFFPNNHFYSNNHYLQLLQKTLIFGQTGVDLFFVLSGFLITRILFQNLESSNYFSSFYYRRSLRIFPLYYGFLIVYNFILPFISGFKRKIVFDEQIWYWIYLQNIPDTFPFLKGNGPFHFWSLAVEEHFYLIWPLIIFLFRPKHILKVSLSLIGMALLTRYLLLSEKYEVFYFTLSRMDSLAIGAILAFLEYEGRLHAFRKYFLVIPALVFPTLVLTWLFIGGKGDFYIQLIKFPFIALIYFSLIGLIITKPLAGKKSIWESDLLRFTGKISYGLYVLHPICFTIVKKSIPYSPILIQFLLACLVIYLVAYFSFRYFESFFLKMKNEFTYKAIA
jgi:peptidoglycan/LPS O-acetylase OafA/YrhL